MIKIVCVGKIKEKFYRDALDEYLKRLQKYSKVNIIELNDYSNNELENEKNEIIKYIEKKDYIITLDIEGNNLSSCEFAKKMDNIFLNYSNITFIIGGSVGIHKDIKSMANYSLSFSKMTFPHQLFRVILLEQIYRAFKIINNESYHK